MLKQIFKTGLTYMVMAFMLSNVAFADVPTQIYVDNTPGDTTLEVPEDTSPASIVGQLYTDADPGDITFSEVDTGTPANTRFDVAANGEISYVGGGLDFEFGITTFNLDVEAFEANDLTTIAETITINITDANEIDLIDGGLTFRYYEEQAPTQPFLDYNNFSVHISDPDAGDDVFTTTVTETSCIDNLAANCSGLFNYQVVNQGGQALIQVTGPTFDFETDPVSSYTVVLEAEDAGGATDTETFTIERFNIGEFTSAETTTPDGVYGIGDTIEIFLNFEDPSEWTYDLSGIGAPEVGGTISLDVLVGGNRTVEIANVPANGFAPPRILDDYVYPDGTDNQFRFDYVVQEGDASDDLDYTGVNAYEQNDSEITNLEFDDFYDFDYDGNFGIIEPFLELPEVGSGFSLSDNADIVVDGIRPTIADGRGAIAPTTHVEGDTIEAILEFSEDLNKGLIDGTSTIDLDIGGTIVTADYDAALTGSLLDNELGFTYIVLAGQSDDDGVDIVENSYATNGDVIRDLADNEALVLTHTTYNLPNDNVGQAQAQPSAGGSGSSSNSGNASSPFNTDQSPEEDETPTENTEEPAEETDTPPEEPTEANEPSENNETEEPVEEPTSPSEPVVTPPTQPVVVTPNPPSSSNNLTPSNSSNSGDSGGTDSPIEPLENDSEDKNQEPDIEYRECNSGEYDDSRSLDCDPLVEFILDDPEAGAIQLNLSRLENTKFHSSKFVITGQVLDQEISTVELFVSNNGQIISLGYAEVDELGRFILNNKVALPENSPVLIYGRDVDSPTQSPDYGLEIDPGLPVIEVDLISFVNMGVNRLFESDFEDSDYWTFVSMADVENNMLNARVKSEFETYHKAYWQSIMFGSSAITGSNSDETTLDSPVELKSEIEPFSRHKVTILAERADAKSVPLVIEYYVLPNGFIPGLAVLILLGGFVIWYVWQKRKEKAFLRENVSGELQSV